MTSLRAVGLLAFAACSSARSTSPTTMTTAAANTTATATSGPASIEAALRAAIDAGDVQATKAALCAAYAARGMECAEPLQVALLAADDVMSGYSDDEYTVKLQPMPPVGGGLAYWDHWSAFLSAGAWQPRALFADDDDARRVANLLLATVLAHELAHHLAYAYRCAGSGPANELRADELSVPLVDELTAGEHAPLRAKLRTVVDAMIAAIPAGQRVTVPAGVDVHAWARAMPLLPRDRRSYVSLHLARQRALAAEHASFAAAAGPACLDAFVARLGARHLLPGRVTTERVVPGGRDEVAALDADGRLYRTPLIGDDGVVIVTPVDGGAPIRIPIAGFPLVQALAVHSPTRLALTSEHVILVDASTTPPTVRHLRDATATSLAFDRDGTLYGLESISGDPAWRIVDVATGRARWQGRGTTTFDWRDGPVAQAELDPYAFTIAGDALVTAGGDALRILDHDVVSTLAGGLPGSRDGSAADAKLFRIRAVRALADGRVRFVEEHGDRWVVRVLAGRR
jgi:hypothetical protein